MNSFHAYALAAALAVPVAANASTFTLDGVYDGDSVYDQSTDTTWYNGHKTEYSIYGDFNDQKGTTTVRYGYGTDAAETSGTEYFWVYVEADIVAKNMIWEKRDWKHDYPITNTDPTVGLTEDDVASYRVQHETHHDPGKMKLDFKGATGSEKMVLNDANGDKQFTADLADGVDDKYGLIDSADITDYLLGSGTCTEDLCLARDTAMSFEFKFEIDPAANNAFLALFDNGIEFHLSPERGLQPAVVPLPASLPFLVAGLGALGLVARRRRRSA